VSEIIKSGLAESAGATTQRDDLHSRRRLLVSAMTAGMLGAMSVVSGSTKAAELTPGSTVKLITLLHRKPGMSREAFVTRYETLHSRIGEKYLKGYASRYFRRYCRSAGPKDNAESELPADVIMEIWFPNADAFSACMAFLMTEEAQAEIVTDEEKMFDRTRMVSFLVDEYESDLTSQ